MRYTNENFNKVYKRKKTTMLIFLLLIVLGFGYGYYEYNKIQKVDPRELNSIIEDNKLENKINIYSKLEIKDGPYQFAVYKKTTNAYYIVKDEKYLYVAYMSPKQAEDIKNKKDEKYLIKGFTRRVPSDVKKLAIDFYNENTKNKKLTLTDYDSYFGDVAIDMVKPVILNKITLPFAFAIILSFILTIVLIINLISFLIFRRKFFKDVTKIEVYDSEINSGSAIYNDKLKLYITKSYIMTLGGNGLILPYADIVWIYDNVYSYNGIPTTTYITVANKKGKKYNVCNCSVTSNNRLLIADIMEKIVDRNPNAMIGYTMENINRMREIKRENKLSK